MILRSACQDRRFVIITRILDGRLLRIAPRSSHHRFDVHNCLCLEVELCSLQHAHFLNRANIDDWCFPSNRFDKATHVRTEKMHSITRDQNTRQKECVSSETFRFHTSPSCRDSLTWC